MVLDMQDFIARRKEYGSQAAEQCLRHKLRILVWSFDLFDVDDKLLVCETGKFAFYLLDLGSALTDDNARFCGVDHDLYRSEALSISILETPALYNLFFRSF